MNQRLPSGPAVIPTGWELAIGVGNSVMAWVVGLIIPILPPVCSVNQTLPSGPAVIPEGNWLWGGEFGDGAVTGFMTPMLLPPKPR